MPNPYRDEKGRYKRLEIPKEIIAKYYVDDRLSLNQVASKLEVSSACILNRMQEFNIKRRSRAEGTHLCVSYKRKINFYQRDFEVRESPEIAYVIGATRGDGCVSRYHANYVIKLTVKDYDFAQVYADCLSKMIGRTFNVMKDRRGYYVVVAYNKRLYEFFKYKPDQHEKIIEKFPADYIRGFYDAEGCASGTITFANTDLPKLKQIQEILRNCFGIVSTCRIGVLRVKPVYVLRVRQSSYVMFATKIGSSIGRKRIGLESLIAKRDEWGRFKHGDNGFRWLELEKQFMRDNYGKVPLKEVAKHLHRKETAVKRKAWVMGVAKKKIVI